MPLVQETRRFKPVHLGHYEVHQSDVRRVNVKGCQGMVPTEGFPNYDPFRTLLQCRLESSPCRRTVIDYKNTDQENSFRCRVEKWTRLYDAGWSLKVYGIHRSIISTMFGRYRLSRREQIIEEHFDTFPGEEDWSPRYNIAPTQLISVIRQNPKELRPSRSRQRPCALHDRPRTGSGAKNL